MNLSFTTNKKRLRNWLLNEKAKLSRSTVNDPNYRNAYWRAIREAYSFLNKGGNEPVRTRHNNQSNWRAHYGLVWPVPIILHSGNRYLGHVWADGASRKRTHRKTGHFIWIQKTVNLNNKISLNNANKKPIPVRIKVAPLILAETERHLRGLGYTHMSTYSPLKAMRKYFQNQPNTWKYINRANVFKKKINGSRNEPNLNASSLYNSSVKWNSPKKSVMRRPRAT